MHNLSSFTLIHFTIATADEEKEKERLQVVRKSNRRSDVCHYFARIFIVLSLSTNFSPTVSFSCDNTGKRIGWET
jgi:hypothetical protein